MNTFSEWLENEVRSGSSGPMSNIIRWLARRSNKEVKFYYGYVINRNRFHTKDVEKSIQNCEVSIEAETMCRASAKDASQVMDKVTYYGIIKDIILLDYYKFKIPLFYCDWANIKNGIKVEDVFTLVNPHQGQHQLERDPFIFASQVKQVFYSRESDTSNWYVVLKSPQRSFYENETDDRNEYMPCAPLDISQLDLDIDNEDCVIRDSEELSYLSTDSEDSEDSED